MTDRRSYNDPCGVARALDVVGERWALLVVRELLLGPKRFTQLRLGLHGASQNVLSQRLRELEQAAVVRRRKLGPPASAWVYELTEWGRDLEPVLVGLGRWGSRVPIASEEELGADALVLALKTTFDPRAAEGLRAVYDLRLGEDRFRAEVADGRVDLVRVDRVHGGTDRGDGVDAVIETNAVTLREVVFGGRPFDDALGVGALKVRGDRRAAARFTEIFPRPAIRPDAGEAGE